MLKFNSVKTEPYGKGTIYTVELKEQVSREMLLDYLGDKVKIDGEEFDVLGVDSGKNKKLYEGEQIRIYTR